jgi:hypothetical protein
MIDFSPEEAISLITQMLDKLYGCDSFLLQKKLNITERAITHRMGMYFQGIVPKNVDVDCEYNRMGKKVFGEVDYTDGDYFAKTVCLSEGAVPDDDDEGSRVFPDIIAHERRTGNNYIIIEVKIDWKSGKAEHDMKKLEAYKADLKYQHAFYLQLTENRKDVRVDVI